MVTDKKDGMIYAMKSTPCDINQAPVSVCAREYKALTIADPNYTNTAHYSFRTGSTICMMIDFIAGRPLGNDWPQGNKMEEKDAKILLG